MEQKKILWIITASGVFLAVVFLAALIINKPAVSSESANAAITPIELAPKADTEATEVAAADTDEDDTTPVLSKEDFDKLESANDVNEDLLSGTVAVETNDDGTVTIDLNQVSTVSAVTPKNETTAAAMLNKKQSEKSETIYTAAPSKKTAAEVEAEKQAKVLNASGRKPQTVASANNSNTQASVPSVATSAAASVAAVKPSYVETTKYWVQCAAYTSKKTADSARSKLDENRIPAEVFTFKDAKENLFYRVRVGPYTTKSEAEYWKNRIAKIDTFKSAQSFITCN